MPSLGELRVPNFECSPHFLQLRDWDGTFGGGLMDRYLNVRFGMVWTDLKDLTTPLRVGDVVILPGQSILHSEPFCQFSREAS